MNEYIERIFDLLKQPQDVYEMERTTVDTILKNCDQRDGNYSLNNNSTYTGIDTLSPEQAGSVSESFPQEIPQFPLADDLLAMSQKIRLKFQEKANRADPGIWNNKALLDDSEQSKKNDSRSCVSSETSVLTQRDYFVLKNLADKKSGGDRSQSGHSNSSSIPIGKVTVTKVSATIHRPVIPASIPKGSHDVPVTLRKVLKENEKLVFKAKEMMRESPSGHSLTFLGCLESGSPIAIPPNEIVFSDIEDVKEMYRLFHQIYSLQTLLHFHQVLKSNIIPLLCRTDAEQSDYRIIYEFCRTILNEEILQ